MICECEQLPVLGLIVRHLRCLRVIPDKTENKSSSGRLTELLLTQLLQRGQLR